MYNVLGTQIKAVEKKGAAAVADKNKSVSETFGKYAQVNTGRGSRVDGPKNITSDMWTPISAGQSGEEAYKNAERAPQKKVASAAPKKNTQSKKSPSEKASQPGFISEGRKKETDGKKGTTSANKKKTARKSRIPKGRPVSELTGTKQSAQKKNNDVRHRQKLSKVERDYDDGIRGGKSPGELSKERAGRKRKKRVRQNVIIITLFLVFALAFAGIYTYSKGAPASVITIEGDSIYTAEEIISAAGLEIGVNMLSVREADISGRVSAALPYIHSVQVKRKFPDKLILTVTPTAEKYLFANKGDSVAVDGYGKVLSNGDGVKLTDGLFRVYGVSWDSFTVGTDFVPDAGSTEKYNLAVSIVSALEKDGTVKKATVNVSDMNNVRVYCVEGNSEIMLYLGSCSNPDSRIALAARVMASAEVSGKTGYIDVRFSNAYFREGSIYLS